MTIIQLEYLLAVANCGSFSLAAEHCFVTQPSLSMQVKALEEELGVVLLDRSKKPVIPTEAGEVVLEQARETIKAYNYIKEAVSELKGETAGKLRLGVIPTIAPYLLHKFIPAFVRDYPKKKDLTPTIDLSGLAGSETVPLLLQWDERWGYREYNESIIGLAGCGPTCLSMVTIYLTGDTTKDPLWMCRFAEQHQFNVPGSGSKWALISEGGQMLGLDVTQIPLDKDRIYRNLDVGNPIIVVVGPGDFTTDGHFLVLTGHDGDRITLNDPNSTTNSGKSWDYDTLAGQIQSLWVLRRAG